MIWEFEWLMGYKSKSFFSPKTQEFSRCSECHHGNEHVLFPFCKMFLLYEGKASYNNLISYCKGHIYHHLQIDHVPAGHVGALIITAYARTCACVYKTLWVLKKSGNRPGGGLSSSQNWCQKNITYLSPGQSSPIILSLKYISCETFRWNKLNFSLVSYETKVFFFHFGKIY